MRSYGILLLLVFFSLVSAQFPSVNKSLICPPSAVDNTNASGTGTFDTGLTADSSTSGSDNANLSWAMTVYVGPQKDYNVPFPPTNISIWIGQPPSMNLYNGSNPFSGCAFIFSGLPLNTIERGQDDDGSCYQTFSKACVTALTYQVEEFAKWQTRSFTGGPYNNLTPPVLDYVCSNIQTAIGEYTGNGPVGTAFPAECQPYFNDGSSSQPSTESFQITSNTTDAFNDYCWVENSTVLPGNLVRQVKGTSIAWTGDAATDTGNYDNATRGIVPVLSVFMPAANNSRSTSLDYATAAMTCLRVSKFSSGSRVSPELPSPTPVHVSMPLSKGAKARMVASVVAVVVIVVLTAASIWFFVARARRRRRQGKAEPGAGAAGAAMGRDVDATGVGGGGHGAVQLQGKEKYEMGGRTLLEADGTLVTGKGNLGPREELEGEAHHYKGSPSELQG